VLYFSLNFLPGTFLNTGRLYFLISAAVFPLFFCSRKSLSDSDCQRLLIQNSKVIAEDDSLPEEMKQIILKSILHPDKRQAFIVECKKTRSKERYRCEMQAETFSDLRDCSSLHPPLSAEQ